MPKPNLWTTPLVDPRTGMMRPEWRLFFQSLAGAGGSAGDLTTDDLAPNQLVMTGTSATSLRSIGSRGLARQVLHGNPTGAPTWGAVRLTEATDVTGVLPFPNGGTGLAGGVSGGVLAFVAADELASSALLATNALVLGGGSGAVPATLASLGTTTTVLHGDAVGPPTFGPVDLAADVSGNLPVTNLNSGTGAGSTTFWRGDGAWSTAVTSIDVTAPAAGILATGGPITTAGVVTLALANDLAALEGLAGTGIAVRTAADTWVQRSIAAGTGISVSNGSGVSGNPTVSIDAGALFANPSAGIGLTAVNGSAATAMRSDAAPALDQGIVPTWTGDHTWTTQVRKSGTVSPAQITSDQNDYSPTGLDVVSNLRINSDAARDVTGLQGGAAGREILITNVGSQTIILRNQSASSSAANRFGFGADVTLGEDVSVLIRYDGTSLRWRASS